MDRKREVLKGDGWDDNLIDQFLTKYAGVGFASDEHLKDCMTDFVRTRIDDLKEQIRPGELLEATDKLFKSMCADVWDNHTKAIDENATLVTQRILNRGALDVGDQEYFALRDALLSKVYRYVQMLFYTELSNRRTDSERIIRR